MTDTTLRGGGEEIAAVDNVQGQLIMPFYILCDVSSSMSRDITV